MWIEVPARAWKRIEFRKIASSSSHQLLPLDPTRNAHTFSPSDKKNIHIAGAGVLDAKEKKNRLISESTSHYHSPLATHQAAESATGRTYYKGRVDSIPAL